jgi:TolB-like protein
MAINLRIDAFFQFFHFSQMVTNSLRDDRLTTQIIHQMGHITDKGVKKMKIARQAVMALAVMLFMILAGCGSGPSPAPRASPQPALGPNELDLAIRDASDYLNDNIPAGSMIVILNVQSDSSALSDYIIDELIGNAVNDRVFKVVDRQQLDLIRTEQNFQLSGEVDDKLALSIGKFFGAQTIVSGKVSQVGDRYRMTIRALEVQTAQVQGQYNRNIIAGVTITALIKGSGGSGGGTQSAPAGTMGSGSSGTGTTGRTSSRATPTVTGVAVSPDNVSTDKGKTHQFSATISGNNNPDQTVTWTVTGNLSRGTNISEDGILTVADDEIATPLTIIATSTVDKGKNGKATVAIPGGISAINVSSVANWNTAINTIRNGGNNQTYIINVTGNVSVPAPPNNENIFGSVTSITVTIQGGGTLALSVSGSLLRIGTGQTVIVRNVTLQGRSGNDSPVIIIMSGGIFRMEGNASVTGNVRSSYGNGGGVIVDGGTFIMQDSASVTGNSVFNSSGGGVNVNSGTFIMQGGAVSGNKVNDMGSSANGGGVNVNGGTFTMEGGVISGNTAGNNGGGVFINGTFTMRGGTISGNTVGHQWSDGNGGGVYVQGGTFTMQGGTITGGNNAKRNGGGVYVNGGTFTKTGGTISGSDVAFGDRNTTQGQGHTVYLNSSPDRWRNATAGQDDNTGGYGFWLND